MTARLLIRLRHRRALCRIEQALATMDELPRAVFERARFRDLDYARIAEELGISIAEVERHLAAAMVHILNHTDPVSGP
ncbi:sigma-70 region 4 domain-containing protein [Stakelama sp. CBK3Z-3]|uniref:Sigma-70 region 4 domain-containing protein n=1 Tax=Stakelama flava TaxID=2860338 RepID=A0ABS6XPU0_9SPHN|nr:sigma-70 region 4 domain-containing protein [Stakelama flava]MBW4332244.1 sigma-70 region 4 domain-containing protein [Stakelama flava]